MKCTKLLCSILVSIFMFSCSQPAEKVQHVKVQRIIPFENRVDANCVPYYVMGDVNQDGAVTTADLEILTKYIASGKKDTCACLAAADWSGNSVVDKNDLRIARSVFELTKEIAIPTLASGPLLPCNYNKCFLFAPGYVSPGQNVNLFFRDQVKGPQVVVMDKAGTITYDSTKKAFTLHIPGILKTKKIHLLISFTDSANKKKQYDLPIPVVPGNHGQITERRDSVPRLTSHDSLVASCPDRNKGCEVLIIDFIHANQYFSSYTSSDDLIKPFEDCKCNVIYTAPKMTPLPDNDSIFIVDKVAAVAGGGSITYKKVENPDFLAEYNAITASNDAEWNRMMRLVRAHQLLVRKGRELVIELVNGHGGNISWASQYNDGKSLRRDAFHLSNYTVVKNNSCHWFTYDFSCQSGYTPNIIENLENSGLPDTFSRVVKNDFHAAFEYNYSFGASSRDEPAYVSHIHDLGNALKGMINNEASARAKDAATGHPTTDYTRMSRTLKASTDFIDDALYIDKGYHFCPLIHHDHVHTGI